MHVMGQEFLLLTMLLPISSFASPAGSEPSLESGYRLMYGLDFSGARAEFARWQIQNPDDPRGPVSQAAGLLFAELDRLGILEAQFFVKNSAFVSRPGLLPDPEVRARFNADLEKAESMALERLVKNARDPDALFAMALVYGLKSDYAALIEKQNLSALRLTRRGADWARKLLAIAPDYYDAYLATGISSYIVGSLFAPLRWMLNLTGYRGDVEEGMQQLQVTAERGCLLAPFARLLLAIAHLRADRRQQARGLLQGLSEEFPSNPLFAREIARLDTRKD